MGLFKIRPLLFWILLLCIHLNTIASITTISPKNIIGGVGQLLTITGNGFGSTQGNSYVSFIQESGSYLDATVSKTLKYNSWIDSKIELEMPVAFSGRIKVNIGGVDSYSIDTLKVKANLGYRNVNPLDYNFLNNTNNKGGYTWYMHRSYWNIPAAKLAIEDVFKEFRCKTGINYILANAPSDSNLKLGDNINLIAPDSVLGVVGFTDMAWGSCILGGTTFYRWSTMDVRMSTKQNWYFGTGTTPAGKSKFRYVLMHELGHSLGLGHVNEVGQTMYPSVTFLPSDTWNSRDTITNEERTAISYFVNLSKNFTFRGCGFTPLSSIFDCNDVFGVSSGINANKNKNTMVLFPNPSNGLLYVTVSNETTIEIINAFGKQIDFSSTFNDSKLELNLLDNPSGIYYLKCKNGRNMESFKFVLKH